MWGSWGWGMGDMWGAGCWQSPGAEEAVIGVGPWMLVSVGQLGFSRGSTGGLGATVGLGVLGQLVAPAVV